MLYHFELYIYALVKFHLTLDQGIYLEEIMILILRPHPTKNVNAGVADVPHIRSCRRRSIAGYATETKGRR